MFFSVTHYYRHKEMAPICSIVKYTVIINIEPSPCMHVNKVPYLVNFKPGVGGKIKVCPNHRLFLTESKSGN